MLLINAHPDRNKPLDEPDRKVFDAPAAQQAERFARARPGYAPTRLVALPGLARAQRVASIQVKDESTRFGLGSFKALGGAYAVIRLALQQASQALGRAAGIDELDSQAVRAAAADIVVACATDGNHGKSVAQGAALVGARAVIFVHAGVSQARVDAIAQFGAQIVRVEGNYDDSVAEATAVAQKNGWTIVSDTSWPGYEHIPSLVMQGYTTLLREAMQAMPQPPTHVFIQAGVGGIAAATAACMSLAYEAAGAAAPKFIVVDPQRAACLFESARLGKRVRVDEQEPTIMAMLECYEPSMVAWRILARTAHAFMTVDEQDAVQAMRTLAAPAAGDAPIVAGESGGVGLAAFLAAARDDGMRRDLGIDAEARIFVINTEGATDPARYQDIVGRTPEAVLAGT
ncbi:diaminopropionate ammonia-lyase [Bordetella bronchiseptica]|uniref:diaminopropionate ammonia-lyase n=1 Tax=Bordetella bronchiseptica TaxID=518 RepID=UPI000F6F4CB7|nr:diaminopropionate ammonia-lyase [Bordetella bronchiseptica]VEF44037.1 Diaminopropionate ammonia-lyase [Bordetella bronchiseptica]